MTTDNIVMTSETDAAIAKSNLAETKPVSEKEKPLENGDIKETETEEVSEEETETEDEEESTEEELEAKAVEEKPKKKGGFQKRIDKLNGRLSAVEQEREYWRQEALRSKAQTQETKVEAKPDLSKKPNKETFATADEYTEALIDWKADQKIAQREQKQREDSIKSEFQTKASKHAERVKTLSATKDDWDDVQETFKNFGVSAAVEQLILDSEDLSAGVVYELGKDPELLQKICKMPYGQAARAIGRIEAKLEKTSTPLKKNEKQTKSLKPVTPVRTKGASVTKGFKPDMSQSEYNAMREEQLKARTR